MIQKILSIVVALWNRFVHLPRKKKLILIGVLVAIGILWSWQSRRSKQKDQYELTAAHYESISETVSETGNITTIGSTSLYATTTGLVQDVYVKNGDWVKKNDPLFSVVATATQQEKDTAYAAYLTAKNTLDAARADQYSLQATMFSEWDTFKELAESDAYEEPDGTPKYEQRALPEFHVPEKDWLAAESNYKNQQAVISQAEVNVSAKWHAYLETQDSTVVAVIDGQVNNLSVTRGDKVTVPTALTLASTLPSLILSQGNVPTIIKVDIGETDAIKIQPGQPVRISFDAIDNQEFTGHVDRVDTIATPADGVVQYSVYVMLDADVPRAHSGLTADVDITVASKDNALVVPTSAVKPYEGGRAVRVVNAKGEIEYIPVETGLKGDGVTEIVSGIDEGFDVIVALKNEQVKRKSGLF